MAFADAPNLGADNTLLLNGSTGLYHIHPDGSGAPEGRQAHVQYANLFHEQDASMLPGAIFYAQNEADVVTVLKYAAAKKARVACRTGGHQYSGASSTSSSNILLDLSQCKVEEEGVITDSNDSTITIRMGINKDLGSLNVWLRDTHGALIPHGHCAHVHLGGHVQSGGYGHSVRAFGLLADNVVGMRVYTADGTRRDLNRNALDNAADKDLFFAMLGGSPGNFGVLVRVDLRAVRASAHPNARGMKLVGPYNSGTMGKLMGLMAEWSDDDELPAGFDYTVTVISLGRRDQFQKERATEDESHQPHPESKTIFEKLGFGEEAAGKFVNECMEHEAQTRSLLGSTPFAFTIVWVQWANLGGKGEAFSQDMQQRFKAIKDCGWWPRRGVQEFDASLPKQDLAHMSTAWAFDIKREFHLPFHKRCHVSTRSNLAGSGYANFLTERLTDGVNKWGAGLRLVMQTQLYGGKASNYTHGDPKDLSCHAWRREHRIILVVDAFYVPGIPGSEGTALKWVHHNTWGLLGPNGCFSSKDMRVLWGSFENTPTELDLNADTVWPFYYRDRATVERLRATKAAVDPTGLLTPNLFSIRPV